MTFLTLPESPGGVLWSHALTEESGVRSEAIEDSRGLEIHVRAHTHTHRGFVRWCLTVLSKLFKSPSHRILVFTFVTHSLLWCHNNVTP